MSLEVVGVELLALVACWGVPLVKSAWCYELGGEEAERTKRQWGLYWMMLCWMLVVSKWVAPTIVPPLVRTCICLWLYGANGNERMLRLVERIYIDIDLDSDFILGNNPAVVDLVRSYKGAEPLSISFKEKMLELKETARVWFIGRLGGIEKPPPVPTPVTPPAPPASLTPVLGPYKDKIHELEASLMELEQTVNHLRVDKSEADSRVSEVAVELMSERSKRFALESKQSAVDRELKRLQDIEVQANEWREEARYLQKLLDSKSLKAIKAEKEAISPKPPAKAGTQLPQTMNVSGEHALAGVYTLVETRDIPTWIMGRHTLQQTPTGWLLTTTNSEHLSPRRGKVEVLVGDTWVPCVVNGIYSRSR